MYLYHSKKVVVGFWKHFYPYPIPIGAWNSCFCNDTSALCAISTNSVNTFCPRHHTTFGHYNNDDGALAFLSLRNTVTHTTTICIIDCKTFYSSLRLLLVVRSDATKQHYFPTLATTQPSGTSSTIVIAHCSQPTGVLIERTASSLRK